MCYRGERLKVDKVETCTGKVRLLVTKPGYLRLAGGRSMLIQSFRCDQYALYERLSCPRERS